MTSRDSIAEALAALRRGLVVGVPTDTVYGIAADPADGAAVARLFAVKGRPRDRAVAILVAGLPAASQIGILSGVARSAAAVHWPGPLTLVVPRSADAPPWVGDDELGSVGVRVPDHPVALDLLEAFGPLAVTSANRSGAPPARDDLEARALLGADVAVYLAGSGGGGDASTVVDLTGPRPVVVRAGPIHWEDA